MRSQRLRSQRLLALFAGWAVLIGAAAWICEADVEPD